LIGNWTYVDGVCYKSTIKSKSRCWTTHKWEDSCI